jgi:hypothetical protein
MENLHPLVPVPINAYQIDKNNWQLGFKNGGEMENNNRSIPKNGPFLGNGKIGYVARPNGLGAEKSIISTAFKLNDSGSYSSNVVDAFDPTLIRLFDPYATIGKEKCESQVLDMYSGIFKTRLTLTHTPPSTSSSTSSLPHSHTIETELYVARHLPYTSIQTITITPDQYTPFLDIFHVISAPLPSIQSVEYNNNVIFNDMSPAIASPSSLSSSSSSSSADKDMGVYILHGKGQMTANQKTISVCSCYVLDPESTSNNNMSYIGFNKQATNPNFCYQKLRMVHMDKGKSYTFHIVTTQMTALDFTQPHEEVKRITLNLVPNVSKIRQAHIRSWMEAWKHNMTIEAKINVTDEERARVSALTSALRYGLYTVWSSIRDSAHTELHPVMDANGNLFWDGDLWYMPLLILFRPTIARNILETRYEMLHHAIRLAAGYGFQGSKFPSSLDVVGYGRNPYWDASSTMHIFNTALISMNVWNYYRVTMDKLWLQNKGYEILKHNADFFASKMEQDEMDGSLHLNNVCSINNVLCDDNTLTNYLAKLAFQFAIEASFELQMTVDQDWLNGYHAMDIQMDPSTLQLEREKKSSIVNGERGDTMIMECLIPLLPLYSETLQKTHRSLNMSGVISANIALTQTLPQTPPTNSIAPEQTHPINDILVAWLYGTSRHTVDTFEQKLCEIIEKHYTGPWSMFTMSKPNADMNDVSLCAMLVLAVMTTAGTIRLGGNVTETRFYTEKMGLKSSHACYMPKPWKSVKITGIGKERSTVSVLNENM